MEIIYGCITELIKPTAKNVVKYIFNMNNMGR